MLAEEQQFARVLETGAINLDSALANVMVRAEVYARTGNPDFADEHGFAVPTLDGKTAFHMYETYGLPLDFICLLYTSVEEATAKTNTEILATPE